MKRVLEFLRVNWYKLLYKAGFVILGILGIFCSQLPDMFPDSKVVSLWPSLAALDVGLADLNKEDTLDTENVPYALLMYGDAGFEAIYGLIREIDRELPRLQDMPPDSLSKIGFIAYSAGIWRQQGRTTISLVHPVELIRTDERGNVIERETICGLQELSVIVRDRKIQLWASFGVRLAVISLLLSNVYNPSLTPYTSKPVSSSAPVVERTTGRPAIVSFPGSPSRTLPAAYRYSRPPWQRWQYRRNRLAGRKRKSI